MRWWGQSSGVAAGAQGYATVEDEGTPLAQRTVLDFVGAGVTATDVGGETRISIPGGGSGIAVQVDDVDVDAAATTLDFDGDAFAVTSAPAGEANVALSYPYLMAFGG